MSSHGQNPQHDRKRPEQGSDSNPGRHFSGGDQRTPHASREDGRKGRQAQEEPHHLCPTLGHTQSLPQVRH